MQAGAVVRWEEREELVPDQKSCVACVADRGTYIGALPRSDTVFLTGSAVYFGYIGEAERLDRAVGPQA